MDKPDDKGESSRRSFLKGIAAMPVVALTGGTRLFSKSSATARIQPRRRKASD